jgi:hypothetical protein
MNERMRGDSLPRIRPQGLWAFLFFALNPDRVSIRLPGLRLIRGDLQNAQILLRGLGPVPGLGGAPRAKPSRASMLPGSWPSTLRHSFIA